MLYIYYTVYDVYLKFEDADSKNAKAVPYWGTIESVAFS